MINGHNGGETVPGSCTDSVTHARVWSAKEDRFVYLMRLSINGLLACPDVANAITAGGDKALLFAQRNDAIEDTTIATTGDMDANRQPHGYSIHGAVNLPPNIKAFGFVTNSVLQIEGDFNRHDKKSGGSWLEKSGGDPTIPDIDEPAVYNNAYNENYTDPLTNDKWKPALLVADHFVLAPNNLNYGWYNNFRWADGRVNELNSLMSTTEVSSRCNHISWCNVLPTGDIEVNAGFLGAYVPAGDDASRNTVGMMSIFGDYVRHDNWIRQRAAKITLPRAKYSTNRNKHCQSSPPSIFSTGTSCDWTSGGNPKGFKKHRDNKEDLGHEPNFDDGNNLPNAFKEMFPGAPARERPFQIDEAERLEATEDPLF